MKRIVISTAKLKRKDRYLNNLVKSLIVEGHVDLLQELYSKHNVRSETKDKQGNTYLNLASQGGNLDILKVIVINGAILDTQNNIGNTPLHHACSYKFDRCMDFLICKFVLL
jgi:ankyrin repeat protein